MKFLTVTTAILILSVGSQATMNSDNTKINKRDQQSNEFTADDQGASKQDTEITREIRRAFMKEKSLSTYAKNIKIITKSGEVTLKGPVRSIDEQKILVRKAQGVVGVAGVFNETDVIAK